MISSSHDYYNFLLAAIEFLILNSQINFTIRTPILMFLKYKYLLAYKCDTEEFIKLPRKFVLFYKNVKQQM